MHKKTASKIIRLFNEYGFDLGTLSEDEITELHDRVNDTIHDHIREVVNVEETLNLFRRNG